jgi:hypothetical protein
MKLFAPYLLFISVLFSATKVEAQILASEEITGRWKLVSVSLAEKGAAPEFHALLDEMRKPASSSVMQFKPGGDFSWKAKSKKIGTPYAVWKYDAKSATVIVSEWEDRDLEDNPAPLLRLQFRREEGKVYLYLIDQKQKWAVKML